MGRAGDRALDDDQAATFPGQFIQRGGQALREIPRQRERTLTVGAAAGLGG